MKRDYANTTASDVKFFTGVEVEHTPAFNQPTLFVVGVQSILNIQDRLLANITHIYFGANQSFPVDPSIDNDEWTQWESMILPFLDKGYTCTLDLPITHATDILETRLVERSRFIPQFSLRLPYVMLHNYNTCIKIDDIDFDRTNPGIWVHQLHTLFNRNVFNVWQAYSRDQAV
jgi:hypothetical protein